MNSPEHFASDLKISVIIPTLNEAALLPATLTQVKQHRPFEIIIGDGGSEDDTTEIARRHQVPVVTSARGRAAQMNAAAREARGDLLLFLHADSQIGPRAYQKMLSTMSRGEHVGGAFSLEIHSPKPSLKTISRLATLRSRYLNLVYGDQGIFVRPDVFREMSGFSSLPICEDLDFFRRLRKRGPVVVLREKMRTSARRWLAEGIAFTTARNIAIALLFLMGFSPDRLSRWYQPKR
ncbi:MAG: glycosyltransferase [Nitrospinaceae bacterium]|nr:glycosyltransferase family 2 protein [Nitrospinaceae bacterium]NIR56281.1 glycosyltransferase family 2 protein [Nitrospinaceae bacterium]NIS86738.1 glycosyltransferase family 2 protein [Nitrospinaceae bacterium]NIT83570.1 glycosyltransferase family 2 protein [Nitrospinaceae bacterium]NIU45775.1 glycosyltransferase family 2 protein [Nitrospinaceae bacterium]